MGSEMCIRDRVLSDFKENFLPIWEKKYRDVTWSFSGEAEGEDQFFAEIRFLSLVAFLAMFALLSIAFKSYFLPLIILSALPFGFCGAVIGHVFFGKGLSMISYWGIGAACGVVVNDNLVFDGRNLWITNFEHEILDALRCADSVCPLPFRVTKLDAKSYEVLESWFFVGEPFGLPSVAVPISNELISGQIVIGSFMSDRLAYFNADLK